MKGCFGFIGMNHSCPFVCPPGQYSSPTGTNGYCYATPGGYYSLGIGNVAAPGYFTCPPGQYPPAVSMPCAYAGLGWYAGGQSAILCSPGAYTSSSNPKFYSDNLK
jgi:hypothetical protein